MIVYDVCVVCVAMQQQQQQQQPQRDEDKTRLDEYAKYIYCC